MRGLEFLVTFLSFVLESLIVMSFLQDHSND